MKLTRIYGHFWWQGEAERKRVAPYGLLALALVLPACSSADETTRTDEAAVAAMPAEPRGPRGTWAGTLNGDGKAEHATVELSDDGDFVYDYVAPGGKPAKLVLNEVGKNSPPALVASGDILALTVDALERQPDALSISFRVSFSRRIQGDVDQELDQLDYHLALVAEGLHVVRATESKRYLNSSLIAHETATREGTLRPY